MKTFLSVLLLSFFSVGIAAKTDISDTHLQIHRADIANISLQNTARNTSKMQFRIETENHVYSFELSSNASLMSDSLLAQKSEEWELLKGKIQGNEKSWARFSLHKGKVKGAFFDGNELFLLDSVSAIYEDLASNSLYGAYDADSEYQAVIVKASDIEHNGTCALHPGLTGKGLDFKLYVDELRSLAAGASSEIRMNIVTDVEWNQGSATPLLEAMENVNFADGIFSEQLGVQLTVDESNQLSENGTLVSTDSLQLINAFRQTSFNNPGLRHLFTGKDMDGSTVGIAYVGALCNQYAAGVTQRLGIATGIVLTHELGHNFGAPHDGQSGTACASTPSGFIMFPTVNTSATDFSSCSISIMEQYRDSASTGPFACIDPVVVNIPNIISEPNLNATVDQPYQYDADSIVDVENDENAVFSLDTSPEGMSISVDGLLSWTPTSSDIGTVPVQIRVETPGGSDTQYFEIEVASDFISFVEYPVSSYGGVQDRTGGAEIGETDFELVLTGNTWKSIDFNYSVTPNTVLEFEYKSNTQAEIHGVGFDTDSAISPETTFKVYGTQYWGIIESRYSGEGEYQTFKILVGESFTGDFSQLVFVLDNDKRTVGADAYFRNIRVYEETPPPPVEPPELTFLDLGTFQFTPFNNKQDRSGEVVIIEDGFGVEITGNKWQKIIIEQPVTPTTVLQFDFKSTQQGEVHGIGFLPGTVLDRDKGFQVYGTQAWGRRLDTYTNFGEYQTFTFPVGNYFTQERIELVFIMDHDISNPTGNSSFKNIAIYDTATNQE
ncbi:M12 family metallo-peptidase [Glaciecola sp. 1036]|uniref:M12 family metallo-peptidase n=1 Tax=Alteromonadaceae TaxID=72275 RepID=UPI003D03FFC1